MRSVVLSLVVEWAELGRRAEVVAAAARPVAESLSGSGATITHSVRSRRRSEDGGVRAGGRGAGPAWLR